MVPSERVPRLLRQHRPEFLPVPFREPRAAAGRAATSPAFPERRATARPPPSLCFRARSRGGAPRTPLPGRRPASAQRAAPKPELVNGGQWRPAYVGLGFTAPCLDPSRYEWRRLRTERAARERRLTHGAVGARALKCPRAVCVDACWLRFAPASVLPVSLALGKARFFITENE